MRLESPLTSTKLESKTIYVYLPCQETYVPHVFTLVLCLLVCIDPTESSLVGTWIYNPAMPYLGLADNVVAGNWPH